MVSFKFTAMILASSTAVLASPTPTAGIESLSERQAVSIPKNSLYTIEWYPEGCGKGGGMALNGAEDTLGLYTKPGGAVGYGEKGNASGVRFLSPNDERVYKWQVFGGSAGCTDAEILNGNVTQCADVLKKKGKEV